MRLAHHLTPVLVLAFLPSFGAGDPPAADPPDRVGRISYISGAVSFRPGSVDDWAAATLNYPLTTGDHVWTDAGARAEVSLGSTAARLGSYTAFAFLPLDDHTTQLRLSQGSLQLRVRRLDDEDTFEIDTPNGAVSLLRPGVYRLDVDSSGDTTSVSVRQGEAEVTAAGSAFSVRAGQAAIVAGIDSPSYDLHDAGQPDELEEWAALRDRRRDEATTAHYVSREVIGYEDLDDAGVWHITEAYGPVWRPRSVVVGWAPYRDGHWAWVDPWGWTWIDDAPWGFAPFHYGRWVYIDGGWAWVPGRIVRRPAYAPALVAFVGGPQWSASLSFGREGGVAWFPLAPDEVYVPPYRVSPTYVRRINVTNVNVTNVNVTNINVTNIRYVNREVPGAITAVSRQTFVAAQPVGRSAVIVPRERVASATIVGTAAPVAPTRESVLAQAANLPARRPPPGVATRPVIARTAPPPPPVPFAARERALQAHPGYPLSEAALASLGAKMHTALANPLVRPAAPANAAPGAPSPLRPARAGGLPAPRPLQATGFAPRPSNQPSAREQQLEARQAAERERLERRHQAELQRQPPSGDSDVRRRLAEEDETLSQKHVREREQVHQRQPNDLRGEQKPGGQDKGRERRKGRAQPGEERRPPNP